MKVECVKDKLRERVVQAERVTGKNLSLPILSSLLLKAEDSKLIIRATNLDLGVEIEVPAKVSKAGEVAVPGSVLNSTLANMSGNGQVSLELVNDNLVVSSDRNTALVKSFGSEEFPTIPAVSEGETHELKADVLIDGFRSVAYSAAQSDIKPEIASVYIYDNDGSLVFVATDSFRLAEKRVNYSKTKGLEGLLIPIKNVAEISKLITGVEGTIQTIHNSDQVSLISGGVYCTSRLVNGVYPDYRQIIPKEFDTEVTILREELLNALKLTNIFSDKFHKVNIKVPSGKKVLEVSARNADVGENTTQIDASVKGEGFDANFNYRYILDGVQAVDRDSIVFQYNTAREVLIMRGVSDPSFQYLVKPMNR